MTDKDTIERTLNICRTKQKAICDEIEEITEMIVSEDHHARVTFLIGTRNGLLGALHTSRQIEASLAEDINIGDSK